MTALLRTLLALVVATSLLSGCPARRQRPGLPPQTALLVTVAGLRADHTSMLLYPLDTTDRPVDGGQRALGRAFGLDDLSEEGVLFANAFAPSCNPLISVASLLTGNDAPVHGVTQPGSEPPLEQLTLAEGLSSLGFETVAFVTHPDEALGAGWKQGFDEFVQYEGDKDTLGAFVQWMGGVDFGRGKRMFLWVHLEGPRFPFEPLPVPGGKDFAHLYTDPGYDGPARGSRDFRNEAQATQRQLTLEDREHITALYDGEVALVTDFLFKLFDVLKYETGPAGLLDRTLLMFAGTGGLDLPRQGEPGATWGSEDRLVDETLRVPFFLRHPDSLTGRRIFDDVVQLQDITPTLFDLFGYEPEFPPQGHSLLALTDSMVVEDFPARDVYALGAPVADGLVQPASVRSDGWRLVRDARGNERLYHADIDIASQRDESENQPELLERLRTLLDAWLAELIRE